MSSSTPRRSGFRLPWAGDTPGGETPEGQTQPAEPELAAESADAKEATPETASAEQATAKEATPVPTPEPTPAEPAPPPGAPEPQPTSEFLHDMIAAMRGVAEQARSRDVAELRTKVEEHVTRLKGEAEERVAELRRRAEADVTAIGEWAKTEAERIRAEAESRVTARRQQLDQQLAADAKRAEREAEEIGGRVSEYERELDAFFAQLSEISDPAAFAAAAKRMPHAPKVAIDGTSAPVETSETNAGRMAALGLGAASAEEQPAAPAKGSPAENGTATATAAGAATASTGEPSQTEKQPTDAELAARLAELDVKLAGKPAAPAVAAPPAAESTDAEVATTVVVKGLGSFGAITAFKQGLEGVDGIRSVTLSLGPSGEFVYRATHAGSFDLEAAIRSVERGATTIERQPDGALRVTISRPAR
jgi:hypothetical protein